MFRSKTSEQLAQRHRMAAATKCPVLRNRSARNGLPARPHGRFHSAFSLVEVTIALGIIAFALVGIMGLFPAAMKTARESQQETQAGFIANQIFGGLSPKHLPDAIFLPTGPDLTQSTNRQSIALDTDGTFYLGFTNDGLPTGTISGEEFSAAIANPSITYATRVTIYADTPREGLSQVEVLVTTPAAAALTNRSRFPFVTLLRNR